MDYIYIDAYPLYLVNRRKPPRRVNPRMNRRSKLLRNSGAGATIYVQRSTQPVTATVLLRTIAHNVPLCTVTLRTVVKLLFCTVAYNS